MTGRGSRPLRPLLPLLLVALAAGAYLTWLLRVELVVLFAAVLFGVALYTIARWLSERSPLSHRVSVAAVYLAGLALAVGFFFFAGQRLTSQYEALESRIPAALEELETRLEGKPVVGGLVGEIRDFRGGTTGEEAESAGESEADQEQADQELSESPRVQLARMTVRTLSLFVVWAVLSFFVAFDGRRYLDATLRLVPPDHRDVGRDLASSLGTALPWWIVGRLSSMAVVAILTAPGLLLLGIPLAFVLAIIAGLFSFVPFVGPIAAVIPAALVALESAPDKLLWVLALYGAVQFLETNLITPNIQKHVASVPPLMLISSQLIMGVLVGIVGVMFATPLVLAAMVTVQVVYLRHALGEDVSTPREDA